MHRAILFDFNGVIVNDEPQHCEALIATLAVRAVDTGDGDLEAYERLQRPSRDEVDAGRDAAEREEADERRQALECGARRGRELGRDGLHVGFCGVG